MMHGQLNMKTMSKVVSHLSEATVQQ